MAVAAPVVEVAPAPTPVQASAADALQLRNERYGRGSALSDWLLANVFKQKLDAENAILERATGGKFGVIPWGNVISPTTVITPQAEAGATGAPVAPSGAPADAGGLLKKLAPLAITAALAAGTGGAGVAALPLLQSFFQPASAPANEPGVIEFPVTIDWKFSPQGQTVRQAGSPESKPADVK
jgi:hypothetical protein